ncbi:MAG TPA: M20/M25/M40 family metallo-hydrolase [Bacillota bacterium]|nr:M20/M25/M40 family metallo-hydrolase [Bacillota bacterium]HPQ61355.1 M20/M25/M40 family metallo-hydrolase [Bacillota bacterium]HRX91411.1 M20/M25/M40 family metallo-hydrolase [Candidatus Izemoplasmatales bacterium]
MDWYWYLVIGLCSIVTILLAVAIIRTFLIKVEPVAKPDFSEFTPKMQEYAENLSRMLRYKTIASISGTENEFIGMQAEMEKMFPELHALAKKKVFPNNSLLFLWKGTGKKDPIVLMAHQDVVPADENVWSYPPFEGTIENGKIYGRGSFDTKVTVFAIMQAINELIKEGFVPEGDVYLAFASDEEVSGHGAKDTAEYLKQIGVKPAFVLDEGGAVVRDSLPSIKIPMAFVGVVEKGYVNMMFKAKSEGGHSSTPPRNTPIARLAMFVNDVERHFPLKTKMIPSVRAIFANAAPGMSFPYRFLFGNLWLFKGLMTGLLPKISPFGRALLSTTIAFTMSSGSDAYNVIPSEANVIANIRIHPIQNVDDTYRVLSKIAAKYDIETIILESEDASKIVDTRSKAYQSIERQIRKNFPEALVSPYIITGATDCRHYALITDDNLRFSPVIISDEDLGKMHGKDETLEIESLYRAVNFYKSLIRDYSVDK